MCLSVGPLRASIVTGGGSETRMLPRPRISPVRVNLPPKQDVGACRYAIYNVAYANGRPVTTFSNNVRNSHPPQENRHGSSRWMEYPVDRRDVIARGKRHGEYSEGEKTEDKGRHTYDELSKLISRKRAADARGCAREAVNGGPPCARLDRKSRRSSERHCEKIGARVKRSASRSYELSSKSRDRSIDWPHGNSADRAASDRPTLLIDWPESKCFWDLIE